MYDVSVWARPTRARVWQSEDNSKAFSLSSHLYVCSRDLTQVIGFLGQDLCPPAQPSHWPSDICSYETRSPCGWYQRTNFLLLAWVHLGNSNFWKSIVSIV